MEKLYVVTRRDLPPGAQAAQLLHAFRAFVAEHPEIELAWFRGSNTITLKSVADERELRDLATEAFAAGVKHASFREPDLGNALTAVTLEPRGAPLVRRLPLALE